MSRVEQQVYDTMREMYRYMRGPLRTVVLADMLSKTDRAVRYTLVRLEQSGRVRRVGQRGGWVLV